jgi:hypothetical protein
MPTLLVGDAANEPQSNTGVFQRQAFPQPAWTHAQAPLRVEHGEAGRGQRLVAYTRKRTYWLLHG